jgi:ATPase subunit of ABC transporter with duplicated ATPase domains
MPELQIFFMPVRPGLTSAAGLLPFRFSVKPDFVNQKLLEVNRLFKTYHPEEGPVLQDVSLRVESGQLLALTGESGSGKTTLLRLIAGTGRTRQRQYSAEWQTGTRAIGEAHCRPPRHQGRFSGL